MSAGGLTPRQRCFVEEYLIDLNATQAAIRAGYSKKTAKQIGAENLAKPVLQDAIAEAMAARSARTEITQDMVVRECARIAFANAGDYFDWGPDGVTLIAKDTLTPEQIAAVAAVSETIGAEGHTKRLTLKLHDKKGALDSLARHLGMFDAKVPIRHERDITRYSDDELLAMLHDARAGERAADSAESAKKPRRLH